jgi:hypothetical protein
LGISAKTYQCLFYKVTGEEKERSKEDAMLDKLDFYVINRMYALD